MTDLMQSAYALKLISESKITDEQKKLNSIKSLVQVAARKYEDAFINAARRFQDAERESERLTQDLQRTRLAKIDEIKAIQDGKYVINFDVAINEMLNATKIINEIDEELKPFTLAKQLAEYRLNFIKEQGVKLGFTV